MGSYWCTTFNCKRLLQSKTQISWCAFSVFTGTWHTSSSAPFEIKASKCARSGCMIADSLNQSRNTHECHPFPIQISVKTSHQQGQDFTQGVLLFFPINTGFEWDWFEIIYVSIQQSHLTSWVKKTHGIYTHVWKVLLGFVQS